MTLRPLGIAPHLRPLSSAGITRPPRYYGPLRDPTGGGLRTYARLAEVGGLRAESKEQMRINVIKHMSNIRKAFRKVDEEFGKAGYGIISVPGRGFRWQSDEPDHC